MTENIKRINKLLREKEERVYKQIDEDEKKRQKAVNKFTNHENRGDSQSAPGTKPSLITGTRIPIPNLCQSTSGGVRKFFNERRKLGDKTPQTQSANVLPNRKRPGYDKSNLLEPITQRPSRGNSDSHIITRRRKPQNGPSEFEKWRLEQDELDRQRRYKHAAQNNKANGNTGNGNLNSRLAEYNNDVAELDMMKRQDEEMRQMLLIQKEEEERERREQIKSKQEKQRREAAEIGRRRREESERKRQEALEKRRRKEQEKQLQREEEEATQLEQSDRLRELEAELEEKKKDLEEIQKRKQYSAGGDDSHVIPTKPKKVLRNVSRQKNVTDSLSITQPSPALGSPMKTHPPKSNSLNKTYRIRETDNNSRDGLTPHAGPSRDGLTPHAGPSRGGLTPRVAPQPVTPNTGRSYQEKEDQPVKVNYDLDQIVDDNGAVLNLAPCPNCGRKFAEERLLKHRKACKIASKPRKTFDVAKQRIAGSGMEEYVNKKTASKIKYEQNQKAKANKKDWRQKREEFVAALRYAKQAAAVEKMGGDVSMLAPPPAADTSDLVPCPTCGRKFNETAAERHIPRCKDIKAKPSTLKKGSGPQRFKR